MRKILSALCLSLLWLPADSLATESASFRPNDGHQTLTELRYEYPEQEPNDECVAPQIVNCGDIVDPAGIDVIADQDWYRFTTEAGDAITIGTEESAGLPPMDTVIYLYADDCTTQLAWDDDSGPGYYSLISDFGAPYTGEYNLLVIDFGNNETGSYKVFFDCIGTGPDNDTCAGAVALERCTSGHLEGTTASAQNDYYDVDQCIGYDLSGKDLVYSLDLHAGDYLEIDYVQNDEDAAVYVVTDCSNTNSSCVVGADAGYTGQWESIRHLIETDGTYYLILDSYIAESGGPWVMDYRVTCTGEVTWVSLDGSPEGTPAEVALDPSSSPQMSIIDLRIHGFWVEMRIHEDEVYQKVTLPDLGHIGAQHYGAPDLPIYRCPIAIPTSAHEMHLVAADIIEPPQEFADYLIWPQVIPALDDRSRTPEQFVRDEAIYTLDDFWPSDDGVAVVEKTLSFKIPSAMGEVYPAEWNPTSRVLRVYPHMRYTFAHGGEEYVSDEMNNDDQTLAAQHFVNWNSTWANFPRNPVFYVGYYRIVCLNSYLDDIQPLMIQKNSRGYYVSTQSYASSPTCATVRTDISNWYDTTIKSATHYLLIVGDVDMIPTCSFIYPLVINGVVYPDTCSTDDLYGSVNGDDLDEEIYVGRLSVDDDADCRQQIAKILRYEDFLSATGDHFDDAVLVAGTDATQPTVYESTQTVVARFDYYCDLAFDSLYGYSHSATNAMVKTSIDAGAGVVAYRGHGTPVSWYQWNDSPESFTTTEVYGLANGTKTPPVWAITCSNSDLSTEDCIGEVWMEGSTNGAVSHYGGTEPTARDANSLLEIDLFEAVYGDAAAGRTGIACQSKAIAKAENLTQGSIPSANPWKYLLLGDPQMRIMRANPYSGGLTVIGPPYVIVLPEGSDLPIGLFEGDRSPFKGGLVAAWKPGEGRNGSEVFENRYTQADGWAHIPINPTTPGWLYFTVQDSLGRSVCDSIIVIASVEDAPDLIESLGPIRFDIRPSVGSGTIQFAFGRPLRTEGEISVYDVSGREVARFTVPAGASEFIWQGTDQRG